METKFKMSNQITLAPPKLKVEKKVKSVLLIDNDRVANFIHHFLLEKFEVTDQIYIAENGKEGLDFLQKVEEGSDNSHAVQFPELIFLDINMPVIDGFQFLKLFKKIKMIKDKKVVIVLLSSYYREDEIEEIRSFNTTALDFMEKPMTEEKLNKLIEKHFS